MTVKHSFGGNWTVEKLDILSKYLNAYSCALKNQYFNRIYIDAFAGTGKIETNGKTEEIPGSAQLSLQCVEQFDEYIFIEKKKKFANELNNMISSTFPTIAHKVRIFNDDANEILTEICHKYSWEKNRAVLFLDPYATAVKWDTLKTIAQTKAIDVWYLFPFSAINRMITKDGNIDPSWKERLNTVFGDNNWETELYKQSAQRNLFGEEEMEKTTIENLKSYIIARLKTIFPYVSPNAKPLYNSRNSLLFLFCFAVSNPNNKAWKLAEKMANDILRKASSCKTK